MNSSSETIFTNKQLKEMIVPLLSEHLLMMLVGIADTLVISYAGEASVSGVSLVNQFNTIFIYLFTALAAGGSVVISQYIGRKSYEDAERSAGQLLMFSTVFSIFVTLFVLCGSETMLRLLFGNVDADVMEACVTYLRISAYSYPALAIYNTGAAIYRSIGKTKVTMNISLVSNGINVVGNIIGVFVLNAGVAGVAWPSFLSRWFSAVVVTWLCFTKCETIRYRMKHIASWHSNLLKTILGIAIPNGIENGIFQLVKVAISSIVALFGTCQIAANGVAQSIWSFAAIAGASMGTVFITVIGQCMGSGDPEAADYYFRKLIKITLGVSIVWNAVTLAATPLFMKAYALEPETKQLVFQLVVIHNIFNALAFPFSGALSNGLRAAGDVKFTMYVSILSTILGRLILSYILGITFGMGVVGIALAMAADWSIRAVLFWARYKKGKWKNIKVI